MQTAPRAAHEKTLEEIKKETQEMNERNAGLYEMARRVIAQREAERAAVLALKKKKEITKSDLVRIFREEREAIRRELYDAESALEEVDDAARHRRKKRTKHDDDADDLRNAIDPLEMALFSVRSARNFSARITERLYDVEQAIMKL